MTAPIAVNVITGFLGSGKTTLLRRILADPGYADCAVLINEFGEVGIDHHIVQRIDGETVLMQSGCICCTIRDDLAGAIRSLHDRREAGTLPPFARLIIETTGLADPTPILATIMNDVVLRHHFRLGNVVATVDAVNGEHQLDVQPESVKQAAIADRLLITKTDLADAGTIQRLESRLSKINPTAPRLRSANTAVPASVLIGEDVFTPETKSAEVRAWLAEASTSDHAHKSDHVHESGPSHVAHDGHDHGRHDPDIHAFTLVFGQAVDWTVFGLWLTLLLNAHGPNVLRVKGILNLGNGTPPVVVNGVQHLIHAPLHLEQWPDGDRRSRLVFIVRGLSRVAIEDSFAAFQQTLARDRLVA